MGKRFRLRLVSGVLYNERIIGIGFVLSKIGKHFLFRLVGTSYLINFRSDNRLFLPECVFQQQQVSQRVSLWPPLD